MGGLLCVFNIEQKEIIEIGPSDKICTLDLKLSKEAPLYEGCKLIFPFEISRTVVDEEMCKKAPTGSYWGYELKQGIVKVDGPRATK